MKKLKYIALLAALLVGFGMYQFLQELNKPVEIPKTQVIVAVTDIKENVPITEEMVAVKEVVTEAKHPDCETNMENVLGMVLESKVYTGEQILSSKLVQVGQNIDTRQLSYKVEPGMRAITIGVGVESGIAYMLRPGDRVDIIVNYSYQPDKNDKEKIISETDYILQNVKLLAIDSIMTNQKPEEGYSTVTLMVSPDDALLLSHTYSVSSYRLVLRSLLDEETVDPRAVNTENYRDIMTGEEAGEQE